MIPFTCLQTLPASFVDGTMDICMVLRLVITTKPINAIHSTPHRMANPATPQFSIEEYSDDGSLCNFSSLVF